MTKTKLVILGNGMVSHRFLEELSSKTDMGQFEITLFCAESRTAYDRVHLSSYLEDFNADALSLVPENFYEKHAIRLLLKEKAICIDPVRQKVLGASGCQVPYDRLVIATGSYAVVPPIQGADGANCFVYRTLEDLDAIAACAKGHQRRGAVIGGGLLGLEAAGALNRLKCETHVIEFAPVLMAQQLDTLGGTLLRNKIEAMGVHVHTQKQCQEILHHPDQETLVFADGSTLDVDFIVFATGIHPYDQLAHEAGLTIGGRGGIAIDEYCRTSVPNIYAIGECASWQGQLFGLVAPGYRMAQIAVSHLLGDETHRFTGADMSTKLKLLGVEVGSIGDAKGKDPKTKSYLYQDAKAGIYKRLVVSSDNRKLRGAVLVGDTSDYGSLLQIMLNDIDLPRHPDSLILPSRSGGKPAIGLESLPDTAQICSCYDVSKGWIAEVIRAGCRNLNEIQQATRVGTGCGGCVPLVVQLMNLELQKLGVEVKNHLCEHFPYSRQELYQLIKVNEIKTFEALIQRYGKGYGCKVCKPIVASLLASCWNEYVLKPDLVPLQDSNDNFLGNIQKDGSYSIIPRTAGGEITPEKLIVIGEIAKKYELYTKITGSQRIALFGAQIHQLPLIWQDLIAAGFESGHAYAKAIRMAKTCVGNEWCRFGVGNSVALGIEIENRYKGIRTPHKIKIGVSGCTRECAEAQGKDIGLIATNRGWNLYVCGNGGMKPRHADLLAVDLDKETVFRYLDRFLVFYIRTADKYQRTSEWLEKMEGGIDYLRDVLIADRLSINATLEKEMEHLRETSHLEWGETLQDKLSLRRFQHFINSPLPDNYIQKVKEREQYRPARPEERIMD